ncbi:MAG: hypothetical protein QM302_09350 [Acidobacteriota bacterium]|nr:hypothetical protein [Acidobacteriota bacterium]
MADNDKRSDSHESPIGGEMGQSPLVDIDIAQEFAKAVGWVIRRIRTDRSSFVEIFIKRPLRGFYDAYQNDPWLRAATSTKMSAVINLFFVFYQAYSAYRRQSLWFATLSVYYAWLTFMRVSIATYMQTMASDGREELRRYRQCGVWLLMLTTVVMVLGVVSNRLGSRPSYATQMLVVVALFALYNVIFALINLYKWRKLEDPLISASKALSLSCALVSIYSLQAAAIGRFAATSDARFISFLTYATPIVIFLIIASISMFIILRVNWVLKAIGSDD